MKTPLPPNGGQQWPDGTLLLCRSLDFAGMLEEIIGLLVVEVNPIGDVVGKFVRRRHGRSERVGQNLIQGRNDDKTLRLNGEHKQIRLPCFRTFDFFA